MNCLFTQVGGEKGLEAAVDLFMDKIHDDALIGHFFSRLDMKHHSLKHRRFLTMLLASKLDGINAYMVSAHAHLIESAGLSEQHFDRMMALLEESLLEAGNSAELTTEVMLLARGLKDAVLSRIEPSISESGKLRPGCPVSR